MEKIARLKRNGWVMMMCGVFMVVYKLMSGTFTDIWLELKESASMSPVLFFLYILLEFATAVFCIYAGFLGYLRYGDVEEVRRSITFSYIVIGLIVINEVILAIALSGLDRDNILTLLIYLLIPGFYIFNARSALKDE